MNKTTEQLVRDLLLSGRHIDKEKMRDASIINSSCLPQRIKDIRYKTDWDIKHRSVPGKGTLREYWLEPEEIARIKGEKVEHEQLVKPDENIAPQGLQKATEQKYTHEQLGLGIPGTESAKEWW